MARGRVINYLPVFALAVVLSGVTVGQVPDSGAEVLRDPTRPLHRARQGAGAPVLRLHSILIGDKRRAAVINGEYLRERDTHRGVTVIRILPGKVIVRQNGVERTLLLHQQLRQPMRKQRAGPRRL